MIDWQLAAILFTALNVAVFAAPHLRAHLQRLKKRREVWVVGEFKGVTKRGLIIWVMKGAFSTREQAVENCAGKNFFIAPVPVNTPIPEEGADLPKCEYPKAEAVNA